MKGTQPASTWEATYFRLRRFLEKKHPSILVEYEREAAAKWKKGQFPELTSGKREKRE